MFRLNNLIKSNYGVCGKSDINYKSYIKKVLIQGLKSQIN